MYSVYKITNLINNKTYIGSSIRVEKRWRQHINAANNKNSSSYNYPLQTDIRQYGVNNFSFEILNQNFSSIEEILTAFNDKVKECIATLGEEK